MVVPPPQPARAPAAARVPPPTPAQLSRWFHLRPEVVTGVLELGLSAPSEIQSRAIPALLASEVGTTHVVAAGTGTGKTLAYLLPLIHHLKAAEEAAAAAGLSAAVRPGRPRALILTPTRELALQVLSVCKRLCHAARFRAVGVVGGARQALQREAVDTEVDVIIATPGRLALLLEQRRIALGDVRHLVIDEVDTMVSEADGFGQEVAEVLRPLLARGGVGGGGGGSGSGGGGTRGGFDGPRGNSGLDGPRGPPPLGSPPLISQLRTVLAGATVPRAARHTIEALFPRVSFLTGSTMHRPPLRLHHRFLRVGGEPSAKHEALLRLLAELLPGASAEAEAELAAARAAGGEAPRSVRRQATGGGGARGPPPPEPRAAPPRRLVVFCNSIPSARSTAHFLSERGLGVASLHGGIPPNLRALEFEAFAGGGRGRPAGGAAGGAVLLVATDAAARGLDVAGLDAVIMFDFPLRPTEYLHRAGRAGRAGAAGTVASLVARGDLVLAARIQAAIDADEPLEGLSAAREAGGAERRRKGAGGGRRREGAGGDRPREGREGGGGSRRAAGGSGERAREGGAQARRAPSGPPLARPSSRRAAGSSGPRPSRPPLRGVQRGPWAPREGGSEGGREGGARGYPGGGRREDFRAREGGARGGSPPEAPARVKPPPGPVHSGASGVNSQGRRLDDARGFKRKRVRHMRAAAEGGGGGSGTWRSREGNRGRAREAGRGRRE